jgi:hypothetical protein
MASVRRRMLDAQLSFLDLTVSENCPENVFPSRTRRGADSRSENVIAPWQLETFRCSQACSQIPSSDATKTSEAPARCRYPNSCRDLNTAKSLNCLENRVSRDRQQPSISRLPSSSTYLNLKYDTNLASMETQIHPPFKKNRPVSFLRLRQQESVNRAATNGC